MSVIFQNLGQLQNRYPDNAWQEILGNCDTQLALGCTDELTATYLSSRTGDVTIGVTSTSKTLSSWQVSDYTNQYRESSGLGRRKLMTMDEILRMPFDKELLIVRGQKVAMLDKFDYTLHPEAANLIKYRASDYIPKWFAEEEFAKQKLTSAAANTEVVEQSADLVIQATPPESEDKPQQPIERKKPQTVPRKKYVKLDD